MPKVKNFLREGDKVKLNVNQIKKGVDYIRLTSEYKDWVKNHTNDIFTVEYDKQMKNNPSIVCLKEDKSVPKWLFWEGNLTIISRHL